jgi:hypothetical protein
MRGKAAINLRWRELVDEASGAARGWGSTAGRASAEIYDLSIAQVFLVGLAALSLPRPVGNATRQRQRQRQRERERARGRQGESRRADDAHTLTPPRVGRRADGGGAGERGTAEKERVGACLAFSDIVTYDTSVF